MNDAPDLELDTAWMERMGEWGTTAQPGKRGLTLEDIRIGRYGELPEESDNMSGRPRGAAERPEAFRIGGYTVRSKREIWLENATFLYEEALQRQWSSATDIPWETIEPLPDDLEEAECALCTFFNEVEFVAGDVPARWVANISPDFFEARNVLLAQVQDEARHMDVFRKRALANGGGLTRVTGATSGFVGSIDLSRDFTEMSEKRMYRLCAQDEARHVAFGIMHLRYLHATAPDRHEEIEAYLDEAENLSLTGGTNPAGPQAETSEALAILLGGGKQHYDEGFRILLAIRKRQLKEYMQRVKSAGFGERFENGRSPVPERIAALS